MRDAMKNIALLAALVGVYCAYVVAEYFVTEKPKTLDDMMEDFYE